MSAATVPIAAGRPAGLLLVHGSGEGGVDGRVFAWAEGCDDRARARPSLSRCPDYVCSHGSHGSNRPRSSLATTASEMAPSKNVECTRRGIRYHHHRVAGGEPWMGT